MKKKKGFTLVELLAVIVIIAVVALIGTVSMVTIKKKMLKKTFTEELVTAVSAAETFGSDNKELVEAAPLVTMTLDGNTAERHIYEVTLDDLIQKDYFHLNCDTEDSDDDAAEGECKKDADGKTVKTFNHYDTNESINDLIFIVYETGESGRVKACIPTHSEGTKYAINETLLADDANLSEFGDAGVYCNPKNTAVTTPSIEASITDADTWKQSKEITITGKNIGTIEKYLITTNGSDCNGESGWKKYSSTGTEAAYKIENIIVGSGATAFDVLKQEFSSTGTTLYICIKDTNDVKAATTITVKKIDYTAPKCDTLTLKIGSDTYTPPNYITGSTTLTAECSDLSGCTATLPTITESGSITVPLKDGAGNTNSTCTATVNVDKGNPYCTQTNTPTKWTKTSRTVTYKCADNETGCVDESSKTETITASDGVMIETKDMGTVTDKAGNTGTCTVTVKIDNKKPTCSPTMIGTRIYLNKYDSSGKYDESGTGYGFRYTNWVFGTLLPPLDYYGDSVEMREPILTLGVTQVYSGYVRDEAGNSGECHLEVFKSNYGYYCDDGFELSGKRCVEVAYYTWRIYLNRSKYNTDEKRTQVCYTYQANYNAPTSEVKYISGNYYCILSPMKYKNNNFDCTPTYSYSTNAAYGYYCDDGGKLVDGNSNYCYIDHG